MKNKMLGFVLVGAVMMPGTIKPIPQGREKTIGWVAGSIAGALSGAAVAFSMTSGSRRPMTYSSTASVAAAAAVTAAGVGFLAKWMASGMAWTYTPRGRLDSARRDLEILEGRNFAGFVRNPADRSSADVPNAVAYVTTSLFRLTREERLYPAVTAFILVGEDHRRSEAARISVLSALEECAEESIQRQLEQARRDLKRHRRALPVLQGAIHSHELYTRDLQAQEAARQARRAADAAEATAYFAARTASAAEQTADNTRRR